MAESSVSPQKFRYRASRADGSIVRGTVHAESSEQALRSVCQKDLFPLEVVPSSPDGLRTRVPKRDLALLFRSVATLIEAGLPVERALAGSEKVLKGRLPLAVEEVRSRLREGLPLSDAMASAPDVFPAIAVGMLRAGEKGSQLDVAIAQIADQLEEEADLVAEVRSALTYPAVVLVVGVVSVVLMVTVVVPRFATILEDLGAALPLSTRVLLGTSAFLLSWGWLIGLTALGVCAAGLAWMRSPAGRVRTHAFLLTVPIVGPIRKKLATARTCRALGGMLETGMPLLLAIEAAGEAIGDAEVTQRLSQVRDRVAAGEEFANALEEHSAVTETAQQLIALGESSGRLGHLTRRAGDLASVEANRSIRALVSLLEPALVVALGVLVAFMAAALLQAVYSVRPGG